VLFEERAPELASHGGSFDLGLLELVDRGPGVTEPSRLGGIDKGHDHFFAGASWLQAVLVIGQEEASVVDNGQVEVVGKNLAEGAHPIATLGRRGKRIGRITKLSSHAPPTLAEPATRVFLGELVTKPLPHLGGEGSRGALGEPQVRAVRRDFRLQLGASDLEDAARGLGSRSDR
jgi:hypothetical protein